MSTLSLKWPDTSCQRATISLIVLHTAGHSEGSERRLNPLLLLYTHPNLNAPEVKVSYCKPFFVIAFSSSLVEMVVFTLNQPQNQRPFLAMSKPLWQPAPRTPTIHLLWASSQVLPHLHCPPAHLRMPLVSPPSLATGLVPHAGPLTSGDKAPTLWNALTFTPVLLSLA